MEGMDAVRPSVRWWQLAVKIRSKCTALSFPERSGGGGGGSLQASKQRQLVTSLSLARPLAASLARLPPLYRSLSLPIPCPT